MSLSVSLGRHFEDYLDRKVASGRYGSASEVLREALRLLEEQDVLLEHKLRRLDEELSKGQTGVTVDARESQDRAWKRMEARAAKEGKTITRKQGERKTRAAGTGG